MFGSVRLGAKGQSRSSDPLGKNSDYTVSLLILLLVTRKIPAPRTANIPITTKIIVPIPPVSGRIAPVELPTLAVRESLFASRAFVSPFTVAVFSTPLSVLFTVITMAISAASGL